MWDIRRGSGEGVEVISRFRFFDRQIWRGYRRIQRIFLIRKFNAVLAIWTIPVKYLSPPCYCVPGQTKQQKFHFIRLPRKLPLQLYRIFQKWNFFKRKYKKLRRIKVYWNSVFKRNPEKPWRKVSYRKLVTSYIYSSSYFIIS